MKRKFDRPSNGHKSYNSAINGVALYVQSRDFEVINKCKDANQFASKLSKLMRRFLSDLNLPVKNNGHWKSSDYNANVIQDNWNEFKNWIESNFNTQNLHN